MHSKTFLVEIGTEELPSKNLINLAKSFANNFISELSIANLTYNKVEWFVTPRRLALKVTELAVYYFSYKVKKSTINQVCNNNDKINQVAKSWSYSCRISINQSNYTTNNKDEYLRKNSYLNNKSTESLLPDLVINAIIKLPIDKLMRWGTSNIRFIRPVHTVTLLLGNDLIPAKILGINSNRIIRGHRFMGDKKFIIEAAEQYPQILFDRGKVIADYKQRKNKIKNDIEEAAIKIGGKVDLSNSLLEEVTSLTEWPVVLTAKFEEKLFNIPVEVIESIIRECHKYFLIYDNNGKLLPNFIFVTNLESKNPQKVISGNEKIIKTKLKDIEFFFNTDLKKHLEDYLPLLKKILFHNQLGTLYDKTNRIQLLAEWIAKRINANIDQAKRAGLLSKCDLMTQMVFEFTYTQGLMGMYYAHYAGEMENVAIAIKEQYQPRFANDKLPSNPVSYAVAIADKMDTLVGILGIGQFPKKNKDPFALRRAALGVLRIIIEKNLNLDLQTLTEETVHLYGKKLLNSNMVDYVINFILKRSYNWYKNQGYNLDIIQSVLSRRPTQLLDLDARIKASSHFRTLKSFPSFLIIKKRIFNILSKINEPLNNEIYSFLFQEEAEANLANSLLALQDRIAFLLTERNYLDALIELTSISNKVDDFFKKVMVTVYNKEVRINRLTILAKVYELFVKVTDF